MWFVVAVAAVAGGCGGGGRAPEGIPATSTLPASAGKVEVRLGNASYGVGEVVRAVVANGLDTSVHTEDFKTVCSIVTLQRSEAGGAWKDLAGCGLGRPTATVTIGAGLSQTIDIDPRSVHFRDGGNPTGFAAGTYRVKFGYRLDRDRMGEEPLAVYSPEFAVR